MARPAVGRDHKEAGRISALVRPRRAARRRANRTWGRLASRAMLVPVRARWARTARGRVRRACSARSWASVANESVGPKLRRPECRPGIQANRLPARPASRNLSQTRRRRFRRRRREKLQAMPRPVTARRLRQPIVIVDHRARHETARPYRASASMPSSATRSQITVETNGVSCIGPARRSARCERNSETAPRDRSDLSQRPGDHRPRALRRIAAQRHVPVKPRRPIDDADDIGPANGGDAGAGEGLRRHRAGVAITTSPIQLGRKIAMFMVSFVFV